MRARDVADNFEHPCQNRHPGRMIVAGDYAYLVSYVESEEEVFLETIIPSRIDISLPSKDLRALQKRAVAKTTPLNPRGRRLYRLKE